MITDGLNPLTVLLFVGAVQSAARQDHLCSGESS